MSHWYRVGTGEPCYTVIGSNGKERPTTLRDARKLNLVCSVTNITGQIDKPFLTQWKLKQLLNACSQWPYDDTKDLAEWEKQVTRISKQVQEEAQRRGNEIHDALETVYKGETIKQQDLEIVEGVQKFLFDKFGDQDWIAEASFASELGYGGKCDLYCKPNGVHNGIIIDFKTKNTDDVKKMLVYDSHVMQLAAYREGFKLPTAECYNLFVSSTTPECIKLVEWKPEDIQRGWGMFKCLLQYWKLEKKL